MTEVIGEEGVAPGEQQAPPKADDGGTPLPHAPPSRLEHFKCQMHSRLSTCDTLLAPGFLLHNTEDSISRNAPNVS